MTLAEHSLYDWPSDWQGGPAGAGRTSAMAEEPLRFDGFQLFPRARLLLDGGQRVRIGDRALDILIALVRQAGTVVSKADLMADVWRNVRVDEGALRVHLVALRRVLRDGERGRRLIVNIMGRGYVFVGILLDNPQNFR
ncbi:winged helix-turn-helix domain-containing protein [Nitrospirillum sp. BR 11164]|uniref:winged helix-turn-helix domain-containing protein n=1 Tax=Nitrospirillum sp. BR 11164 TaxID=3104324 RepID=UPI002AFF5946|nr:winged helix-turn-helix domain-containing protein [Nitrospirillum sp. BR 11164]MEA1648559.1 winged helix-turn-helix domain-containing protein [Nitrospirillum sp. BR 11164]